MLLHENNPGHNHLHYQKVSSCVQHHLQVLIHISVYTVIGDLRLTSLTISLEVV